MRNDSGEVRRAYLLTGAIANARGAYIRGAQIEERTHRGANYIPSRYRAKMLTSLSAGVISVHTVTARHRVAYVLREYLTETPSRRVYNSRRPSRTPRGTGCITNDIAVAPRRRRDFTCRRVRRVNRGRTRGRDPELDTGIGACFVKYLVV